MYHGYLVWVVWLQILWVQQLGLLHVLLVIRGAGHKEIFLQKCLPVIGKRWIKNRVLFGFSIEVLENVINLYDFGLKLAWWEVEVILLVYKVKKKVLHLFLLWISSVSNNVRVGTNVALNKMWNRTNSLAVKVIIKNVCNICS